MAAEGSKFQNGLSGLVLTGWQRYDHFAVLCELLPAALPSLALCLAVTAKGNLDNDVKESVSTSLSCPEPSSDRHPWIDLNSDSNLYSSFGRCLFPGHAFFKLIQRLESVQSEAAAFLENTINTRAWMTEYNTRRNYSAPLRVYELMTDASRIMSGLTLIVRSATPAMEDIFDTYTIAEWLEQRVYPTIKQMEELERNAKNLKEVRIWSVRPLPYLRDLQRLGLPVLPPE